MATMLPCPFCGGTKLKVDSRATESFRDHQLGKSHAGSVRCSKCHARGPTVSFWAPKGFRGNPNQILEDRAIEAWNKGG